MSDRLYCAYCVAARQGRVLQLFTTAMMVCEVCDQDLVAWKDEYATMPVVTSPPTASDSKWQERVQDLRQRGMYMMLERLGNDTMRVCMDLTAPYTRLEVIATDKCDGFVRSKPPAEIHLAAGKEYAELLVTTSEANGVLRVVSLEAIALDGQAIDPNIVDHVVYSYTQPTMPIRGVDY